MTELFEKLSDTNKKIFDTVDRENLQAVTECGCSIAIADKNNSHGDYCSLG